MLKTVVAGIGLGYTQKQLLSLLINSWESYIISRCNTICSVCSKQKKGIKSSIGRLFGKKEKGGRMEPTVGRDGQTLPALTGPLPKLNTPHPHWGDSVIHRGINQHYFAVFQTLRWASVTLWLWENWARRRRETAGWRKSKCFLFFRWLCVFFSPVLVT